MEERSIIGVVAALVPMGTSSNNGLFSKTFSVAKVLSKEDSKDASGYTAVTLGSTAFPPPMTALMIVEELAEE